MKKNRLRSAIAILLGGLALFALGYVIRSRIQASKARGALQANRTEIPVPVNVLPLHKGPIRQWITSTGNARAVHREFLTFEAQGRVTYVKQVGDRDVQEGDQVPGPTPDNPNGTLLARLDDKNQVAALKAAQAGYNETLEQAKVAQATVDQAQSRLTLARKRYEREEELLAVEATAQESFEKAQADSTDAQLAADVALAQKAAAQTGVTVMQTKIDQAKIELEKTRIYCPIGGVVAYKNLEVGWLFSQKNVRTDSEQSILNSIPFLVIDASALEITVDVPAFESAAVQAGQQVQIRPVQEASSSSGLKIVGRVTSVTPAVNPGDRSTRVRILTQTGSEHLRDGEYVQCRILVSEKQDVIAIPFHATIVQDGQLSAFVVNADNRAQRRALTLGIHGDDQFEIVGGLAPGERIVTTGRFSLYEGVLVEALPVEETVTLD